MVTTPIAQAINIGPILSRELRQVGITTLEELRSVGYLEAWRRVHRFNPDRDCGNSCLALAGAIADMRWMKLPNEMRTQIVLEARAERDRIANAPG